MYKLVHGVDIVGKISIENNSINKYNYSSNCIEYPGPTTISAVDLFYFVDQVGEQLEGGVVLGLGRGIYDRVMLTSWFYMILLLLVLVLVGGWGYAVGLF